VDFTQRESLALTHSADEEPIGPGASRAPGVPRPGTPEQLSALQKLAGMLTRSLDLDEVLKQVRCAVIEVLGFDRCGVWLVDEEQRTVQGRWGTDRQGNLVDERHLRFNIGDAVACFGWVAQGCQPFVFLPDFEGFARQIGKRGPSPAMEGVKENAGLAMRAGGRVVGVITFDKLLPGRPFGLEDVEAMRPFVDLAAAAVANARLYDRSRRQESLLREILEISRELSAELALGRVLTVLIEAVTALADVPCADLLLKADEETLELLVGVRKDRGIAYNHTDNPGAIRVGLADSPLLARALREGRPVATEGPDDPQYSDLEREWAHAHGYQATAVVPIMRAGRAIGLLTLVETRCRRRITASEIEQCQLLATQAAVAIENARLYETVERSYRELQAMHERLVQNERLHALGEMAGGVAHHFNNALAAVLGNAELALRPGAAVPEVQERLQAIARTAREIAATVRRVQEFARVSSPVLGRHADLMVVAEQALAGTRALWADRSGCAGAITVTRLLWPVLSVAADAGELSAALAHVIENAVEAMPDGGRLTLETAVEAESVVLRVRDTGSGIPTSVRPRIFEPFFTTRPAPRRGLGLSVAYGVVTRYGGTVEVESQEGMGSTFTFRFPPAQQSSAAGGKAAGPAALPTAGEPARRAAPSVPPGRKILVVEDDPLVREVVESTLAIAGYETVGVASAEAALTLIEGPDLGLVITDHGLPGISGSDLAQHIKRTRPELPVLLLTGWAADLDQGVAIAPVDLLLTKPVAAGSLQEAVRALLARGDRESS
jgi:signal transduction histidine kinase/CheY-like chemotaxis protein